MSIPHGGELINPPVVAFGGGAQGIDHDEWLFYSLIAKDIVDALPIISDVNTLYDHASGVGAHLAEWVPLSAAVENGSSQCVAYFMTQGANPRQRLPTYWSQMRKWRGYQQHKVAISDEILSEATAKMAAVLAEHYHSPRDSCSRF